jgi:hypothetical protein
MGEELANSQAFGRCQVTKVYRSVCLGEPDNGDMTDLLGVYNGTSANMKEVFAKAATLCMGG